MGLVLPQEVEMKWGAGNKRWFVDKGYQFTKLGDSFIVKVEDLSYGSHVKVECECDNCHNTFTILNITYTRCVKDDGKYYCRKCGCKLFNAESAKQTRLKKSTSFKQWCYDNLSEDKATEVLLRWDYELNKCSPDEICYGSTDKCWFKCLANDKHKSELKCINSITSKRINITCHQCNFIINENPESTLYLTNKEDALKYSSGSDKKLLMRCPDCGYEKYVSPHTLHRQGFSCNNCGDGISYPEKVMFSFFEQIGVDFILQYSKANISWCEKYRYDFYLPDYNAICEVHGAQHYLGWCRDDINLEFIKENDSNKKKIALANGINSYIEIDASESNTSYIKNSIINSKLNNMFDLSKVNWIKCETNAQSSLVKMACDLWNNGIKSTKKISNKMKLTQETIEQYLKKGTNIGLCNYNPKLSIRKKVICLNTGELFESITIASQKYNIYGCNISGCCKGKKKSAGTHLITGEKLIWRYSDNIEPKNEWKDIIYKANEGNKGKRVISLNTLEVFDSVKIASIKYNIDNSVIGKCCKGKIKYAGKHPVTKEPLKWMYYSDYTKESSQIA